MNNECTGGDSAIATDRVGTALQLILDRRLELFVNLAGQAMIALPTSGNSETSLWPLRSERVSSWIAAFIWDRLKVVLAEREIERVVMVLIGRAYGDQRTNIALAEAIEQDPLLDALLVFMHQNAVFDKSCTALRAALNKVARAIGLDMRDHLWPKGVPQLSRRISDLADLLLVAGITTKIGRRGSGVRFVKLTRTTSANGDDHETPPQGPSVDKSHHPKPLGHHVDADDETELFSRLESTSINGGQS
ncbi:hypothetical protein [Anatilimnocola floriformis]|uniref:hypothetical protein n=1 Tax=Anatilimnocola floriformis TaxID=2948575 RepID=UPI0020C54F2D|nr:hypothetical protein [Anatilimnocola floriformis]